MKTKLTCLLATSGLLFLASCAAPMADSGHAARNRERIAAKAYPLKTCLVSGDKLGEDGEKPVVFDYQGQEIKLCCESCKPKFDKNPAKYLAKLH